MTLRTALLCLFLPQLLLAQTTIQGIPIIPAQGVRITTCPRGDSVLGPMPDGYHPGLRGGVFAPGVMHLTTQPSATRQIDDPAFSFTLTALERPHPAIPQGHISVMIGGSTGRAILKAGAPPALRFELPDSIVLKPLQAILGRYDGPEEFAVAPLTATLTPASVQAMALATGITVVADSTRLEVPPAVLASLHDVFRTALCGYLQPVAPN